MPQHGVFLFLFIGGVSGANRTVQIPLIGGVGEANRTVQIPRLIGGVGGANRMVPDPAYRSTAGESPNPLDGSSKNSYNKYIQIPTDKGD